MESDTNTDVFSTTNETKSTPSQNATIESTPTPTSESNSTPTPTPTKSKFEFNGISIILCVIVVILIAVIVYLIVKKPKINNELLTKTQEMYKESAKKNKELSLTLEELTKKNKVLESTNENIMKNNSALKDQLSDVQNRYSDIQGELNDYKSKEAQELELKNASKPKTRKEQFNEQYYMINKPKEDASQQVEEHKDDLSDNGQIKLDTTGIAAQQEAVKQQMTSMIDTPSADLQSVMATLNN
jgi:cell division protein FtsL